MKTEYEVVIGLETHVQLKTQTKLFSSCPAQGDGGPNTATDPIVLGMPGVLPTLNEAVVEGAVRVGLALSCSIQRRSAFARKHYFYPDLPKGYQITQDEHPICRDGLLTIDGRDVRVERIHLEEDAGKTIHDPGRGESRVDYNRAGTPLIEIVTRPDLRSPEEAVSYLKHLHEIVVFLGVSDGDMEEGNFRFDANVSLRPKGATELGTKTELKNMNSFRYVQRALEAEIERHAEILSAGGEILQETRTWNEEKSRTEGMRSKESAPDYRYMPEPDLSDLIIDEDWLDSIVESQPELPEAKRQRFQSELGLSAYDAEVFTGSPDVASYFEDVMGATKAGASRVASWVGSELLGLLARNGHSLQTSPITPAHMSELLDLIEAGTVSGKMGKEVLEKVLQGEGAPGELVSTMGAQLSNPDELRILVLQVLERCPEQVNMYKQGKTKVIGYLMGQVMKESRGKANPGVTTQLLQEELQKS